MIRQETIKQLIILLILLGSVSLGMNKLSMNPPWVDELSTWRILTKNDFQELLFALKRDNHPPLYFYLMKGWMALFGTHDIFLLRFPSVLFYAFGNIFIWRSLRYRLKSMELMAAVTILLASSPLEWAQEFRPYALFYMLSSLFMWVALRIINDEGRTETLLRLFFWTGLLCLSTHYLAWPMCFSALAYFFYLKRSDFRFMLNLVFIFLGWIIPAICWMSFSSISYISSTRSDYWVQSLKFEDIYDTLHFLFNNSWSFALIWLLSVSFHLLKPSRDKSSLFLGFVSLSTLGLSLIKSILSYPIIVPRYFIGLIPFLMAFFIKGVNSVKFNRTVIVLYALSALSLTLGRSKELYPGGWQRTDEAISYLKKHFDPKKHVLLGLNANPYLFNFFLEQDNELREINYLFFWRESCTSSKSIQIMKHQLRKGIVWGIFFDIDCPNFSTDAKEAGLPLQEIHNFNGTVLVRFGDRL